MIYEWLQKWRWKEGMDGWMGGWLDGWMDGWTDERINENPKNNESKEKMDEWTVDDERWFVIPFAFWQCAQTQTRIWRLVNKIKWQTREIHSLCKTDQTNEWTNERTKDEWTNGLMDGWKDMDEKWINEMIWIYNGSEGPLHSKVSGANNILQYIYIESSLYIYIFVGEAYTEGTCLDEDMIIGRSILSVSVRGWSGKRLVFSFLLWYLSTPECFFLE